MDCIHRITSEQNRLDDRKVSASFHIAVIEEALRYIAAQIGGSDVSSAFNSAMEMRAACDDALEAVAELRTSRA